MMDPNTPSHGPHGALGWTHVFKGPPFPRAWTHRPEVPELDEVELALAWEVARTCTGLPQRDARALLLALVSVRVSWLRGSTRISLDALEQLASTVAEDAEEARRAVLLLRQRPEAVRACVGIPGDYAPLVVAGEHVALQRAHALEHAVLDAVKQRAARGVSVEHVDAALADVDTRPELRGDAPVRLNELQRSAVRAALAQRLSVVTGGPGTGKTSTVVGILRALSRVDPRAVASVALAAPTGKAADRLHQGVVGALQCVSAPAEADSALARALPPAMTLHRLLGWNPGTAGFRHHRNNPLDVQVVIVDEASMLDVSLAERLLDALPMDARLVLLGDADQLPSIQAGALFRGLCAMPGVASTRLLESYRMDPRDPAGRSILACANAVLQGDADALPRGGAGVTWMETQDARERVAFLETWFGALVEHPAFAAAVDAGWSAEDPAHALALLDHVERRRLLCALREAPGLGGVAGVNRWFRARLAQRRGMQSVTGFLPGEPVVVHTNDHALGLFNGDAGVVLRGAAEDAPLFAVFRQGTRAVAHRVDVVAPILEPAWAITVHKAQGSESDHVALLLPDADSRVLTRPLLYTAITRARSSVTVMGTREVLAAAIQRDGARETWMAGA